MPTIPFSDMPDRGRLWIFAAPRALASDEEARFLDAVDGFLGDWKAHGQPLLNAREWRDGRFLMVAVDPESEPPSGCSIDAMVRVLKKLEGELGLSLTDHAPVHYRSGEGIRSVDRAAFRRLAREGEVTPDTPVFDTTLSSVGALRSGAWERPARESWHGRAFFKESGAAS